MAIVTLPLVPSFATTRFGTTWSVLKFTFDVSGGAVPDGQTVRYPDACGYELPIAVTLRRTELTPVLGTPPRPAIWTSTDPFQMMPPPGLTPMPVRVSAILYGDIGANDPAPTILTANVGAETPSTALTSPVPSAPGTTSSAV